nr:glycerate-2-kinase family protein [Chloroflexota bacterium]
MSDGTESQDDRRAILAAALDAANPAAFVERVLRVARTGDETTLTLTVGDRERSYSGRRVVLLAVGKAAAGMAHGAIALLGDAVTGGLVVTTVGGPQPPAGLDLLVAGHPLPDERSVEAARRTGALVDGLGENDLLLILVSGGASALLADLPPSTSLDEYIALTEGLLRSGADIGEINTVRRAAGTLKGGRLALRAVPARVVSLLLSDVVGDDPAVIGSGLTVPSPTDANDAWAVLDQHGRAPPPGIAAFLHAAATHPLYDRPCHGGAPH